MFGIAGELKAIYDKNAANRSGNNILAATGGAVRKSAYFRGVLERVFDLKVSVPACEEAAAYGSCMFAGVASGIISSIEAAAENIIYS